MNSFIKGISLLPGVFLTTGTDRVKVLSSKIVEQKIQIENLKNWLLSKEWEHDLQANQIASYKVQLDNLRTEVDNKTDTVSRQVRLVKSLKVEAQTSSQQHQWEVRGFEKEFEKISGALNTKSKILSEKEAKISELFLKHTSLKKALVVQSEYLSEGKEKINELALKLEDERAKHELEIGGSKAAMDKIKVKLINEKENSNKLSIKFEAEISKRDLKLMSLNRALWIKSLELQESSQTSDEFKEKSDDLNSELNNERLKHDLEICAIKSAFAVRSQELLDERQISKRLRNHLKEKCIGEEEQKKLIKQLSALIDDHVMDFKRIKSEWAAQLEKVGEYRKTIKVMKDDVKEHVKNLLGRNRIIAEKSEEIKDLQLVVEVNAWKISNLTEDLKNLKKINEWHLKAIEKAKKSNEDKRLKKIFKKNELLATQDSQMEQLKARLEKGNAQMASQSGEILGMKKEIHLSESESGSDDIEFLNFSVKKRKRKQSQKEYVSASASSFKKDNKYIRKNRKRAITRASKRYKKRKG